MSEVTPEGTAAPVAAPVAAAGVTAEPGAAAAPAKIEDHVPELVRVAKLERKAADAIKGAEEKATALAAFETKQGEFNKLVESGDLLGAARLYFPDDEAKVDKLFLQLTDYVAGREDPKEPTVDEKIQQAFEAEKSKAKKEADEKAEADKKAKDAAEEKKLSDLRTQYFTEARRVLASNPTAFPLVTEGILSGEITAEEITGHVEAIGQDILKLKLPPDQLNARLAAETNPEALFAALEEAMRREKGIAAPVAAAGAPAAAGETLEQITAAAVAQAERRPVTSISSSAVRGASPVVQKRPEDMSSDELNAWSIAEAEKKHRGTAAAG